MLESRLADLERQLETLRANDVARPVAARAKTAIAQSIPNGVATVVNYGTVDLDTDAAITTGAAWRYTAALAGYYHVDAAVLFAATTTWALGEYADLRLYKNGVWIGVLSRRDDMNSSTTALYQHLAGSDLVSLAVGDFIDIRLAQASGAALTLHLDANFNYVSIHKVN